MKYKVFVGISQMEFTLDTIGDALDFASTCLDNGYRVTIVAIGDEEDEV